MFYNFVFRELQKFCPLNLSKLIFQNMVDSVSTLVLVELISINLCHLLQLPRLRQIVTKILKIR